MGRVTTGAIQDVFDIVQGIDVPEYAAGNQAVVHGRTVSAGVTAFQMPVRAFQGYTNRWPLSGSSVRIF